MTEGGQGGAKEAPPLSIQDKRREILKRVKKDKMAAKTLGGALEEEKMMKKGSLSPPSWRRGKSKSPQRPRSMSPMATESGGRKTKKNKNVSFSLTVSGKHDKAQEVSFVNFMSAFHDLTTYVCCRPHSLRQRR